MAWTAKETRGSYISRLQKMTDNEYIKEARHVLWFSAFANNNPRCEFHEKADELYTEAVRRAGGGSECPLYQEAFDDVYEDNIGSRPNDTERREI